MVLPSSLATRIARRSHPRILASLSPERHFSYSPPRRNDPKAKTTETPWWSLSSLHKRVATILATSLPESYRSDLHQSLSASLKEEDSHKSHSVNEAIVSAEAREASAKHKSSGASLTTDEMQLEWLEKQRKLEEEIEQRALEKAQERMQLEMVAMQEQMKKQEEQRKREEEEHRKKLEVEYQRKLAFEQWKSNVEKEKEGKLETTSPETKVPESPVTKVPAPIEEEPSATTNTKEETKPHPILGRHLATLPTKRIHLMSAKTLASLPVYEKQRAYRHDRAQLMAKDKKKTLWMGIPGVISLMEDESGKLSILDGQHRVGMMALLCEEQNKLRQTEDGGEEEVNGKDSAVLELAKLDLENILVEVFPQRERDESVLANDKDLDDRATIFTEINKAEPIKLLDLPGVATKQTRNIIDHAASHFHDAFPAMFSASQKCRAPHLNLDNLRDALFASDIIKREKIGSGGELVKWMVKKNLELKEKFSENAASENVGSSSSSSGNGKKKSSGAKVSNAALSKARKHDFYLGLESTWLYK